MKHSLEVEEIADSATLPFVLQYGGPLQRTSQHQEPEQRSTGEQATFLDTFVTIVKWVFLYLPGTALIHFLMMGFALLYFYKDWEWTLIAGSAGLAVFGTFMIMLGIGKLTDLRYLRVIGGIAATSAIAAILYSILIVFVPGDFFGFFTRLTLPLTLFAGYMIKKDSDRKFEE